MTMTSGPLNPVGGERPEPQWMKAAKAALGLTKSTRDYLGRIPPGCRFALLTGPHQKPKAFGDLVSLAKAIHRERGDAALQIASATLYLPGEDGGRAVVKVTTLCEGSPHRFIGYAWVGEVHSPRDTLMHGLNAVQPRRFEVA